MVYLPIKFYANIQISQTKLHFPFSLERIFPPKITILKYQIPTLKQLRPLKSTI